MEHDDKAVGCTYQKGTKHIAKSPFEAKVLQGWAFSHQIRWVDDECAVLITPDLLGKQV